MTHERFEVQRVGQGRRCEFRRGKRSSRGVPDGFGVSWDTRRTTRPIASMRSGASSGTTPKSRVERDRETRFRARRHGSWRRGRFEPTPTSCPRRRSHRPCPSNLGGPESMGFTGRREDGKFQIPILAVFPPSCSNQTSGCERAAKVIDTSTSGARLSTIFA
jgi:hypothetical protein